MSGVRTKAAASGGVRFVRFRDRKPAELLLAHRHHRHGEPPGTPKPASVSPQLCRGVSSLYCVYSQCRSPFEKSQFLPDRNVTARPVDMTLRFRGTRPPRNGITAKRRVRARGSRAGAGLPGRAAQPLRPSFSPSIIRRPCEPAEPLRVVSRGRSCAAARSRPACQDQHRRWPEAPRLSRCLEVRRARLRARRRRRPEVRPVQ
jgi:hypothetical protein